ncbi:MAG: 16S rRNA (adenine(1518)-N(6)/adenine(1519)-N(6))-dimethyltransferase RsmA [Thaumarchaeota archaeon]|nr:16S rRNA (adenine(1518)-N(6)/adenine(1519)-N(6))-dimethyltransferase RsmA [Nitrososphaerota archaeon]MCL5318211.1 16S rRNA (adenine(1518)-N(6)/adenine(1519)-N(6))-dimethyltransferase RsmA [Nitrososphaerota archaeon]
MKRRRRLGQHLLKDPEILDRIVEAAHLSKDSVVFEIGTGEGDLTVRLCRYAGQVISTEIDRSMFEVAASNLHGCRNLELILGDGFSVNRSFNVLVSNIPYSRSRQFVEWLVERRPERAVVTIQKEFGDKLLAEPGADNYRAVTVVAQAFFQVTWLFDVGREAFSPPPQVDSTVLLLQPRREDVQADLQLVSSLKTLFSFRGRQVSSALKHIFRDEEARLELLREAFGVEMLRKRVEHLTVDEAVTIAKQLVKSTE